MIRVSRSCTTYLLKRRYQRKKALIRSTNHNTRDEWQNAIYVVTVNDEYTKEESFFFKKKSYDEYTKASLKRKLRG